MGRGDGAEGDDSLGKLRFNTKFCPGKALYDRGGGGAAFDEQGLDGVKRKN